ncbi:hypothetical protein WAI453_012500 [Rhynchosporium graminicola]
MTEKRKCYKEPRDFLTEAKDPPRNLYQYPRSQRLKISLRHTSGHLKMLTIPPAKKFKLDDVKNAAPTFRHMGSEVVELFVGSEKIKFIADKDLPCAKVPYFEKMYRGGFSEATTNSANFAGDTVSFDILLGWLYSVGLRARTDNRIFFGWGPIDKLVDFELLLILQLNLSPRSVGRNSGS